MLVDKSPPDETMFELNMTPMIDIVFNLLMFFLVATRYAEIERDLNVNPPSAKHVQAMTATPRELIINVTKDGAFLINGVEYPLADLEALIARAVKENPDQAVVVRGDRKVILQLPVDILNLCEKYEVKRKFITTMSPGS